MTVTHHNLNYSGDNAETARWQAVCDTHISEMARLRRESPTTLSALDRLELQELVVLWEAAYDALDKETFLSLMTDDVTMTTNAFGNVNGLQGMAAWWDNFTQTFHGKRHTLVNFVTVGSTDKAKMLCYMVVFERILSTDVVATAVYYDDFVKQDGVWKMCQRTLMLDPSMGETPYGKRLFKKFKGSAG